MASAPTSATAYLPDGNHFLFYDSGKLDSANYTTVVFLHGSAFNAKNFDRVHTHAAANNMRVIALQRRNYPGSSPYTEAEIVEMKNGSKSILDGFAISMAYFINYLAHNLSIPKVSQDRKSGGVALVSWSMAALVAMPLFSDLEVIPSELHPVLEDYVKDLVFYEPSELSLGFNVPENSLYQPFSDPKYETMAEKFMNFVFWVDHYFKFPANWNGDINALDSEKRENCGTFDGWPIGDVMNIIDINAANYDMPFCFEPMQIKIREMTRRVFFDKSLVSRILPQVSCLYISCRSSIYFCHWGAYKFRQMYDEHVAKGERVRPVHFVYLDANHFAHIDHPDELLKAIKGAGEK